MVQLSKEVIEIDGQEYTLFMNRKGLSSWENITKLQKTSEEMSKKYENVKEESSEPIEVADNDNPFDYVEDDKYSDVVEDENKLREIYVKFYWIALYENHKLSVSDARKLFEKAEEEYGIEQLINLANQMVEDMNRDKNKAPIKKLKALRPAK